MVVLVGPSVSEGSLSLDTIRTSGTEGWNPGAASSSECPRKGSVLMQARDGRVVIMNTNCNTWRCKGCRDRNLAKFKAKVATGVLRLGRSAFTTLTYKADSKQARPANYVAKDWRAFFRRLRTSAPWVWDLEWLRVMELTKKGTPHHHLVMGMIPPEKRIRCWSRGEKIVAAAYQASAAAGCECLAHEMSRAWFAVTHDSWMVHAIPVTSGKGAGGYMAKYMGKEFDGERAQALGMQRRWSTSRGWPGSGRLRLRATLRQDWVRTTFRYGHVESDIEGGPVDLLEREGDSLDAERSRQRAVQRFLSEVERNTIDA